MVGRELLPKIKRENKYSDKRVRKKKEHKFIPDSFQNLDLTGSGYSKSFVSKAAQDKIAAEHMHDSRSDSAPETSCKDILGAGSKMDNHQGKASKFLKLPPHKERRPSQKEIQQRKRQDLKKNEKKHQPNEVKSQSRNIQTKPLVLTVSMFMICASILVGWINISSIIHETREFYQVGLVIAVSGMIIAAMCTNVRDQLSIILPRHGLPISDKQIKAQYPNVFKDYSEKINKIQEHYKKLTKDQTNEVKARNGTPAEIEKIKTENADKEHKEISNLVYPIAKKYAVHAWSRRILPQSMLFIAAIFGFAVFVSEITIQTLMMFVQVSWVGCAFTLSGFMCIVYFVRKYQIPKFLIHLTEQEKSSEVSKRYDAEEKKKKEISSQDSNKKLAQYGPTLLIVLKQITEALPVKFIKVILSFAIFYGLYCLFALIDDSLISLSLAFRLPLTLTTTVSLCMHWFTKKTNKRFSLKLLRSKTALVQWYHQGGKAQVIACSLIIFANLTPIAIESLGNQWLLKYRSDPIMRIRPVASSVMNPDGTPSYLFSDGISTPSWTLTEGNYTKAFNAENASYIIVDIKNTPQTQFFIITPRNETFTYYPVDGQNSFPIDCVVDCNGSDYYFKVPYGQESYFDNIAVINAIAYEGNMGIVFGQTKIITFYTHGSICILINPINFTLNSLQLILDGHMIQNYHPWDGTGNDYYNDGYNATSNPDGATPYLNDASYDTGRECHEFRVNFGSDDFTTLGLHELQITVDWSQLHTNPNDLALFEFCITSDYDFDFDSLIDVDEMNYFKTLAYFPTCYIYYTTFPETGDIEHGEWQYAEAEINYIGDTDYLSILSYYGEFKDFVFDSSPLNIDFSQQGGAVLQMANTEVLVSSGSHVLSFYYNDSYSLIDNCLEVGVGSTKIIYLSALNDPTGYRSSQLSDVDADLLADTDDPSPQDSIPMDTSKLQQIVIPVSGLDTKVDIFVSKPSLDYYDLSHQQDVYYQWDTDIVQCQPVLRLYGSVNVKSVNTDFSIASPLPYRRQAPFFLTESITSRSALETLYSKSFSSPISQFSSSEYTFTGAGDPVSCDYDLDGYPENNFLYDFENVYPDINSFRSNFILPGYNNNGWKQGRLDFEWDQYIDRMMQRSSQIIPASVTNSSYMFEIYVPQGHPSLADGKLDLRFDLLWQVTSLNIADDLVMYREMASDQKYNNVIYFIWAVDTAKNEVIIEKRYYQEGSNEIIETEHSEHLVYNIDDFNICFPRTVDDTYWDNLYDGSGHGEWSTEDKTNWLGKIFSNTYGIRTDFTEFVGHVLPLATRFGKPGNPYEMQLYDFTDNLTLQALNKVEYESCPYFVGAPDSVYENDILSCVIKNSYLDGAANLLSYGITPSDDIYHYVSGNAAKPSTYFNLSENIDTDLQLETSIGMMNALYDYQGSKFQTNRLIDFALPLSSITDVSYSNCRILPSFESRQDVLQIERTTSSDGNFKCKVDTSLMSQSATRNINFDVFFSLFDASAYNNVLIILRNTGSERKSVIKINAEGHWVIEFQDGSNPVIDTQIMAYSDTWNQFSIAFDNANEYKLFINGKLAGIFPLHKTGYIEYIDFKLENNINATMFIDSLSVPGACRLSTENQIVYQNMLYNTTDLLRTICLNAFRERVGKYVNGKYSYDQFFGDLFTYDEGLDDRETAFWWDYGNQNLSFIEYSSIIYADFNFNDLDINILLNTTSGWYDPNGYLSVQNTYNLFHAMKVDHAVTNDPYYSLGSIRNGKGIIQFQVEKPDNSYPSIIFGSGGVQIYCDYDNTWKINEAGPLKYSLISANNFSVFDFTIIYDTDNDLVSVICNDTYLGEYNVNFPEFNRIYFQSGYDASYFDNIREFPFPSIDAQRKDYQYVYGNSADKVFATAQNITNPTISDATGAIYFDVQLSDLSEADHYAILLGDGTTTMDFKIYVDKNDNNKWKVYSHDDTTPVWHTTDTGINAVAKEYNHFEIWYDNINNYFTVTIDGTPITLGEYTNLTESSGKYRELTKFTIDGDQNAPPTSYIKLHNLALEKYGWNFQGVGNGDVAYTDVVMKGVEYLYTLREIGQYCDDDGIVAGGRDMLGNLVTCDNAGDYWYDYQNLIPRSDVHLNKIYDYRYTEFDEVYVTQKITYENFPDGLKMISYDPTTDTLVLNKFGSKLHEKFPDIPMYDGLFNLTIVNASLVEIRNETGSLISPFDPMYNYTYYCAQGKILGYNTTFTYPQDQDRYVYLFIGDIAISIGRTPYQRSFDYQYNYNVTQNEYNIYDLGGDTSEASLVLPDSDLTTSGNIYTTEYVEGFNGSVECVAYFSNIPVVITNAKHCYPSAQQFNKLTIQSAYTNYHGKADTLNHLLYSEINPTSQQLSCFTFFANTTDIYVDQVRKDMMQIPKLNLSSQDVSYYSINNRWKNIVIGDLGWTPGSVSKNVKRIIPYTSPKRYGGDMPVDYVSRAIESDYVDHILKVKSLITEFSIDIYTFFREKFEDGVKKYGISAEYDELIANKLNDVEPGSYVRACQDVMIFQSIIYNGYLQKIKLSSGEFAKSNVGWSPGRSFLGVTYKNVGSDSLNLEGKQKLLDGNNKVYHQEWVDPTNVNEFLGQHMKFVSTYHMPLIYSIYFLQMLHPNKNQRAFIESKGGDPDAAVKLRAMTSQDLTETWKNIIDVAYKLQNGEGMLTWIPRPTKYFGEGAETTKWMNFANCKLCGAGPKYGDEVYKNQFGQGIINAYYRHAHQKCSNLKSYTNIFGLEAANQLVDDILKIKEDPTDLTTPSHFIYTGMKELFYDYFAITRYNIEPANGWQHSIDDFDTEKAHISLYNFLRSTNGGKGFYTFDIKGIKVTITESLNDQGVKIFTYKALLKEGKDGAADITTEVTVDQIGVRDYHNKNIEQLSPFFLKLLVPFIDEYDSYKKEGRIQEFKDRVRDYIYNKQKDEVYGECKGFARMIACFCNYVEQGHFVRMIFDSKNLIFDRKGLTKEEITKKENDIYNEITRTLKAQGIEDWSEFLVEMQNKDIKTIWQFLKDKGVNNFINIDEDTIEFYDSASKKMESACSATNLASLGTFKQALDTNDLDVKLKRHAFAKSKAALQRVLQTRRNKIIEVGYEGFKENVDKIQTGDFDCKQAAKFISKVASMCVDDKLSKKMYGGQAQANVEIMLKMMYADFVKKGITPEMAQSTIQKVQKKLHVGDPINTACARVNQICSVVTLGFQIIRYQELYAQGVISAEERNRLLGGALLRATLLQIPTVVMKQLAKLGKEAACTVGGMIFNSFEIFTDLDMLLGEAGEYMDDIEKTLVIFEIVIDVVDVICGILALCGVATCGITTVLSCIINVALTIYRIYVALANEPEMDIQDFNMDSQMQYLKRHGLKVGDPLVASLKYYNKDDFQDESHRVRTKAYSQNTYEQICEYNTSWNTPIVYDQQDPRFATQELLGTLPSAVSNQIVVIQLESQGVSSGTSNIKLDKDNRLPYYEMSLDLGPVVQPSLSDFWGNCSTSVALTSDYDEDGLTFEQEIDAGTSPYYADTDGDGLSDSEEKWTYRTDPEQVDTDTDGLTDAQELGLQGIFSDSDDISYAGEQYSWFPNYLRHADAYSISSINGTYHGKPMVFREGVDYVVHTDAQTGIISWIEWLHTYRADDQVYQWGVPNWNPLYLNDASVTSDTYYHPSPIQLYDPGIDGSYVRHPVSDAYEKSGEISFWWAVSSDCSNTYIQLAKISGGNFDLNIQNNVLKYGALTLMNIEAGRFYHIRLKWNLDVTDYLQGRVTLWVDDQYLGTFTTALQQVDYVFVKCAYQQHAYVDAYVFEDKGVDFQENHIYHPDSNSWFTVNYNYGKYLSDPLDADSDNDYINDGQEVKDLSTTYQEMITYKQQQNTYEMPIEGWKSLVSITSVPTGSILTPITDYSAAFKLERGYNSGYLTWFDNNDYKHGDVVSDWGTSKLSAERSGWTFSEYLDHTQVSVSSYASHTDCLKFSLISACSNQKIATQSFDKVYNNMNISFWLGKDADYFTQYWVDICNDSDVLLRVDIQNEGVSNDLEIIGGTSNSIATINDVFTTSNMVHVMLQYIKQDPAHSNDNWVYVYVNGQLMANGDVDGSNNILTANTMNVYFGGLNAGLHAYFDALIEPNDYTGHTGFENLNVSRPYAGEELLVTYNVLHDSLNPLCSDTDCDGVNDLIEANILNTLPTEVDTDSDGLTDYAEFNLGYDGTDASDPYNKEAQLYLSSVDRTGNYRGTNRFSEYSQGDDPWKYNLYSNEDITTGIAQVMDSYNSHNKVYELVNASRTVAFDTSMTEDWAFESWVYCEDMDTTYSGLNGNYTAKFYLNKGTSVQIGWSIDAHKWFMQWNHSTSSGYIDAVIPSGYATRWMVWQLNWDASEKKAYFKVSTDTEQDPLMIAEAYPITFEMGTQNFNLDLSGITFIESESVKLVQFSSYTASDKRAGNMMLDSPSITDTGVYTTGELNYYIAQTPVSTWEVDEVNGNVNIAWDASEGENVGVYYSDYKFDEIPFEYTTDTGVMNAYTEAYYPLDAIDSSQNPAVTNDISGNFNTAYVYGPTLTSDRFGNPNSAFYFDGSDDCVYRSQPVFCNPSQNGMTWAAWVFVENRLSYTRVVIDQRSSTIGVVPIVLRPYDNEWTFYWKDTSSNTFTHTTSFSIPIRSWLHLAVTLDGAGQVHEYLNGNLLDSFTTTAKDFGSRPITIGSAYFADNWFKGNIDDVRVYSKSLSAEAIKLMVGENFGQVNYPYNLDRDYTTGYSAPSCVPTLVNDRKGNSNRAYEFDGSNDIIDYADSTIYESSEITMSAWIYTHSLADIQIIVSKRATDGSAEGYIMGFKTDTNTIFIDYGGASSNRFNTGYTPTINTWTHLVYTYGPDKSKFYVNGLLYATSSYGLPDNVPNSANLTIGNDHITSGYGFDGAIDDVNIYSRALTPFEISRIYRNLTVSYEYDLNQEALAHYKLDGNADDSSNSKYDGWVANAQNTADRFGNYMSAMHFDGSVDYCEMNLYNFDELETGEFSVALWVQCGMNSGTACADIFGNHASDHSGIVLQQDQTTNNRYIFHVGDGSAWHSSPYFDLDTNWHHIVISYSKAGSKIYKDGTVIASYTDYGIPVMSNCMWLGQGYTGTPRRYWNGTLDDMYFFTRALTEKDVTELYRSGVSDIVADYRFDGGSLADNSKYSNTLAANYTYHAPTPVADRFGKDTSAYLLDGIDDYFSTGITTTYSTWTVSAWVKHIGEIGVYPNNREGIITGTGTGQEWYPLVFLNDGNGYYAEVYNTQMWASMPSNNAWHHYVVSQNGTDTLLYVDGELKSIDSDNLPMTPMFIGKSWSGGGLTQFLSGCIDDVQIYNRGLTSKEVTNLYVKDSIKYAGPFDTGYASVHFDTPGTKYIALAGTFDGYFMQLSNVTAVNITLDAGTSDFEPTATIPDPLTDWENSTNTAQIRVENEQALMLKDMKLDSFDNYHLDLSTEDGIWDWSWDHNGKIYEFGDHISLRTNSSNCNWWINEFNCPATNLYIPDGWTEWEAVVKVDNLHTIASSGFGLYAVPYGSSPSSNNVVMFGWNGYYPTYGYDVELLNSTTGAHINTGIGALWSDSMWLKMAWADLNNDGFKSMTFYNSSDGVNFTKLWDDRENSDSLHWGANNPYQIGFFVKQFSSGYAVSVDFSDFTLTNLNSNVISLEHSISAIENITGTFHGQRGYVFNASQDYTISSGKLQWVKGKNSPDSETDYYVTYYYTRDAESIVPISPNGIEEHAVELADTSSSGTAYISNDFGGVPKTISPTEKIAIEFLVQSNDTSKRTTFIANDTTSGHHLINFTIDDGIFYLGSENIMYNTAISAANDTQYHIRIEYNAMSEIGNACRAVKLYINTEYIDTYYCYPETAKITNIRFETDAGDRNYIIQIASIGLSWGDYEPLEMIGGGELVDYKSFRFESAGNLALWDEYAQSIAFLDYDTSDTSTFNNAYQAIALYDNNPSGIQSITSQLYQAASIGEFTIPFAVNNSVKRSYLTIAGNASNEFITTAGVQLKVEKEYLWACDDSYSMNLTMPPATTVFNFNESEWISPVTIYGQNKSNGFYMTFANDVDYHLSDTDGNGFKDRLEWLSGKSIPMNMSSFRINGSAWTKVQKMDPDQFYTLGISFNCRDHEFALAIDGQNVYNGEMNSSLVYLNQIKVSTHTSDSNYYVYIHEIGYQIFDADTDGDGLYDQEEIYKGTDGYYSDPVNADIDSDRLLDAEELQVSGTALFWYDLSDIAKQYYGTDPYDNDTDNDNMTDGFEVKWGFRPKNASDDSVLKDGPNNDYDGDGLTNAQECLINQDLMNPKSCDSDSDGMPDGWEYNATFRPDSSINDPTGLKDGPSDDKDGDWMTNLEEYQHGPNMNPTKNDTDTDGMWDGWEHDHYLDPLDATNYPNGAKTGPTDDKDNDGASNYAEFIFSIGINSTKNINQHLDPEEFDTDDDNISDGFELTYYNNGSWPKLNPLNSSDGTTDADGDGLSNYNEYYWTSIKGTYDPNCNPLNNNSDSDGLPDGWEVANQFVPTNATGVNGDSGDPDNDAANNNYEYSFNTNPRASDTDNDGMPDGWEIAYYAGGTGLNPLVNDANGDLDSDGLTNLQEFQLGTHPSLHDSDGDGMWDGWEYGYGLNPSSSSDKYTDKDGDGLNNYAEWTGWNTPNGWKNPAPNDIDTDDDVLYDNEEYNYVSTKTGYRCDPTGASDTDNLNDHLEAHGWDKGGYYSDPTTTDTDSDSLTDNTEYNWGSYSYYSNPQDSTTDDDELTDYQEYSGTYMTDPRDIDTDDDYVSDGKENSFGTNPRSSSSYPVSSKASCTLSLVSVGPGGECTQEGGGSLFDAMADGSDSTRIRRYKYGFSTQDLGCTVQGYTNSINNYNGQAFASKFVYTVYVQYRFLTDAFNALESDDLYFQVKIDGTWYTPMYIPGEPNKGQYSTQYWSHDFSSSSQYNYISEVKFWYDNAYSGALDWEAIYLQQVYITFRYRNIWNGVIIT